MDQILFNMQIKRIREILPEMDEDEIKTLSIALPLDQASVIKKPCKGLMMAKARDCFHTDFFIGEVLVSRAEVEYNGRLGQATLMGDHLSAVLVAALLEALCIENDIQYVEGARAICAPAAQRLALRQEHEARLLAATKVDFHAMAKES
jgi:phosphonate C-P lyase system protein PhnG